MYSPRASSDLCTPMELETIHVVVNTKACHVLVMMHGCERDFVKLHKRLKLSGGTTSIQTLARKNVVTNNACLVKKFIKLTIEKKNWKWSRASDKVKQVKKLELVS